MISLILAIRLNCFDLSIERLSVNYNRSAPLHFLFHTHQTLSYPVRPFFLSRITKVIGMVIACSGAQLELKLRPLQWKAEVPQHACRILVSLLFQYRSNPHAGQWLGRAASTGVQRRWGGSRELRLWAISSFRVYSRLSNHWDFEWNEESVSRNSNRFTLHR